jgi:hypothetical protein
MGKINNFFYFASFSGMKAHYSPDWSFHHCPKVVQYSLNAVTSYRDLHFVTGKLI